MEQPPAHGHQEDGAELAIVAPRVGELHPCRLCGRLEHVSKVDPVLGQIPLLLGFIPLERSTTMPDAVRADQHGSSLLARDAIPIPYHRASE
jgi:hypothetical protein